MFENASRLKLRFETSKGNVTTEDLWDLPLISRAVSLDSIAKSLNKQLKENGEESFVVKQNKTNSVLNLKFDIVKYIIKIKLEEKDKKDVAIASKQKKEMLLGLIAEKENEELKSKDLDELKKMVSAL